MNIVEFIEMFITTYRLTHGAKLHEDYFSGSMLFVNRNKIMEVCKVFFSINIYFWIPQEDKVFINLLEKVYAMEPNIFEIYNEDFRGEKYNKIILDEKNSSHLEWYNEILKILKRDDD